MSISLSLAALPAVAVLTQEVPPDATALWAAIALCAVLITHRPVSHKPVLSVLAFATAMLLTSLALVTA